MIVYLSMLDVVMVTLTDGPRTSHWITGPLAG